MTTFWMLAAALLVVALLLVLPALVRARPAPVAAAAGPNNLAILREQLTQLDAERADGLIGADQHRAARREIERRVLEEEAVADAPAAPGRASRTALALVVTLPLLAAGLYGKLGNPQAITLPGAAKPAAEVSQQDVEAMVQKLAERMEAQPGDPRGWALLGRTYAAMQRFPEADRAYSKALALSPQDAQLLADQADVKAMLQEGKVAGAPEALLERALKIDPANVKALALAGSAAFERGDFALAIAHWSKARAAAPAGSEFAQGLDRSLDEARAKAGKPAPAAAAVAAASAAPAAPSPSAASITGQVSLAPALAAKAVPGDTVFIFARAADGPRMPLAILRKTVAELPTTFTLDDSLAMSPALKLSNFPNVVVGARVSKSGNAMPQPGDLVGQVGPVKPGGGAALTLVIDGVQP